MTIYHWIALASYLLGLVAVLVKVCEESDMVLVRYRYELRYAVPVAVLITLFWPLSLAASLGLEGYHRARSLWARVQQ